MKSKNNENEPVALIASDVYIIGEELIETEISDGWNLKNT